MLFIVSGRQLGKTVAILDWLVEKPDGRIILVVNHDRKKYLVRALCDRFASVMSLPMKQYWESIIVVARPDEFLRGRTNFYKEVGIDDLDALLRNTFGDVGIVTASGLALEPKDTVNGWQSLVPSEEEAEGFKQLEMRNDG